MSEYSLESSEQKTIEQPVEERVSTETKEDAPKEEQKPQVTEENEEIPENEVIFKNLKI